MAVGIVVPADDSQPLRLEEFLDYTAYQKAVGGCFQPLDLQNEPMTIFVNDEGKLEKLPPNKRATIIWWALMNGIAGHDILLGDAVLMGDTDDDGETRSIPNGFVLLTTTVTRFRVEYVRAKDDHPRITKMTMNHWLSAFEMAVQVQQAFPDVISTKVVPA